MTVQQDLFGNIQVAPVSVSRELLTAGLCQHLIGCSAEQLVNLMYSEFEAIVDFTRLCRGDRSGQKISMLFNPHRYDTATSTSESIVSALQSDSFADGLARAVAFKADKVRDLLYQVLQLGINGIQYVNEFPPHLARDIYSQYGGRRILDPCAGWGGRMIGAAAVGSFYCGYEPATRTAAGLFRLGEWLKTFDTGFDYEIHCLPFEDATIEDTYDLALTSPPYFDTEHYSNEPTQAAIRHNTFVQFTTQFFLPMIEKAASATRHGLILNIGDRKYPLSLTLETAFPQSQLLPHLRLGGTAGLGKETRGGEVFYLVED